MRLTPRWLAALALQAALAAALVATPAPAREPLPELPDYVFAVWPEEENLDVVIFGESRPALIRLRVRINDRGFRTAWDEFTFRLHDYLDADGDRVLTASEAARGPWPRLFTATFGESGPAPVADPPAGEIDTDPKDGKVSLAELSRYLRETLGHDACKVQPGTGPDGPSQSAFAQLDLDSDGVLAAAELTAAEGLIRRLDADDDETVALAELRPRDNPYAGIFDSSGPGLVPVAPDTATFVPLTTAAVRKQVARRIVARYDGGEIVPRDERLSRTELGLGNEAFRAADTDRDGTVDAAELERFLASPVPSLVLIVRLGRAPGPVKTLELAGPEEFPGPLAAKVKKSQDGTLTLDLDGVEIGLSLNDAVRDLRKFLDMRFNEADANKDGSLDRDESERSRIFEGLFEAADRNADERLSRRELTAYLDRTVDATESRLMLSVTDSGRSVFEVLDADGDHRLGRRELRGAALRLKRFDRDGDGRVALAELPRTYGLSAGRGPVSRRRGPAFETYDSPLPARAGARGDDVSWFRHMDRNHDGDISPREFLGTADDFRKLDADGDGLIDATEAAKGP
jgi:Ca2+-binding EF-hand superfamily protein